MIDILVMKCTIVFIWSYALSNALCVCYQNPISQINMRDARVEEVEKVSDSEGEDAADDDTPREDLTIGIFPSHQGPTYLIMPNKQEKVTCV